MLVKYGFLQTNGLCICTAQEKSPISFVCPEGFLVWLSVLSSQPGVCKTPQPVPVMLAAYLAGC